MLPRRAFSSGAAVTGLCSFLQSLLRPSIILEPEVKKHRMDLLRRNPLSLTPCLDGHYLLGPDAELNHSQTAKFSHKNGNGLVACSVLGGQRFGSYPVASILLASKLKYHDTGKENECLPQVGQWNIFGADVTHPETGEGLLLTGLKLQNMLGRFVLIQNLFKTWHDPQKGTVTGGMIRELLISFRK